jgi:hypothetical protein
MQLLKRTIKEGVFDSVFTEVDHGESLGLKNPHQLRMFHLDVMNNAFSFDGLHYLLLRNIGRYVFSRAKIDQFKIDGDLDMIVNQATRLLRRACNASGSWVGEELGNIMLYIFLEQILGAPKLFSKIELSQFSNQNVQDSGGVHLLSLENGGSPSYQMVFGKSNIIGDLQDAIDNAFNSLVTIRDNLSEELQIVESTIFAQAYDPQTTDYLKSLIIPGKQKNTPMDRAFGVFLGYSLGLDGNNYSNLEFRKVLMEKMNTDIKAHAAYIMEKIKKENLSSHSFYFYILPFNDADNEKIDIMNELLGGGVV